jgi:hypothetical protein
MVRYQLNMARRHVIPAEKRRKWRNGLAIYFVLAVGVLGVCVSLLTREVMRLRQRQERVSLQERMLIEARPGVRNVRDHVAVMGGEMTVCLAQLEAASAFYAQECQAAGILFGLVDVLPGGMELGQIGIDTVAGKLDFEVYVPAARKLLESETPPNLIARWSVEPLMAGRVRGLTAEKTERLNGGGWEMLNWHFTGTLAGGK